MLHEQCHNKLEMYAMLSEHPVRHEGQMINNFVKAAENLFPFFATMPVCVIYLKWMLFFFFFNFI